MADVKGNGAKAAAPAVAPKVTAKMPAVPTKVVPGKPGDEKKKTVAKANSKFTLLKEVAEGTTMPLQCKQIIAILGKAKDKTLDRETLLKAMTALPIVTRQPIERILGFYQSRLITGGYIKIEAVPVVKAAKKAVAEDEEAE